MDATTERDVDISQKYVHPPALNTVLIMLAAVSLIFCLFATTVGFHNSILDFHGFRQTQTAISADAILHGGSFLRYETPVMGAPWSVPFEFPLYQGIVAVLARIFSAPLDQTGRLVSILFYYLCFFPLASIMSRIGLRRTLMTPVLALFAMSPIYVFVSRLFMIESTAVFLSLMYTDQMFRLVVSATPWRYRHVAGAAIFGVLAGLVKVTTLAPFFVLGSCLAAWGLWKTRQRGPFKISIAAAIAIFCVALPVVSTARWTGFADALKSQNPLGYFQTSRMLRVWDFGTLAQRLSFHNNGHLVLAINNEIGSLLVTVLVIAVYVWLIRRWSWMAVICVALYIGTIEIFFNLHVVHEYYPYSNAVLIVVANGLLIAEILKLPGRQVWLGVSLLALQMAACGYRYFTHYYPMQAKNALYRPAATALVNRATDPQSVILILGLNWSSEFPYQSHRRAIMDMTMDPAFDPPHTWKPVEQAIINTGPKNISALVACEQGRYEAAIPLLLKDIDMNSPTRLQADDCDIYVRAVSAQP